MPCHRAFAVPAVCCLWMFGSLGLTTAHGQVQSLPPSMPLQDALPTPLAYQTFANGTVGSTFERQTMDMGVGVAQRGPFDEYWGWQILPQGLMYGAYLAGGRESRFASHWMHEADKGWLWDIALGGHVGMLRYGSPDPIWPEGWQLDIEGAAFPRLTLGETRELVSVDFRFGIPVTFRRGPWETKFGFYHLSSHLGDEYMVRHATLDRLNYSRDVLIAGLALRPNEDLRLYAEAGWAFHTDGSSRPWEFQFGIDYSPLQRTCILGTPFFAVNARIREEVDFGGNITVQTGLQWRGQTGRLLRAGVHYLNGKTDQHQFLDEHEEQIGIGMWYDF